MSASEINILNKNNLSGLANSLLGRLKTTVSNLGDEREPIRLTTLSFRPGSSPTEDFTLQDLKNKKEIQNQDRVNNGSTRTAQSTTDNTGWQAEKATKPTEQETNEEILVINEKKKREEAQAIKTPKSDEEVV